MSRALTRTDDNEFQQAMLAGIAALPEHNQNKPSKRSQLLSLGIKWEAGCKQMNKSIELRKLARTNDRVILTRLLKRKGLVKMTKAVIATVQRFICDHRMVVDSLIANDTLLIIDEMAGKKTKRVGKLLLHIPICELHNDLVEAAQKGELPELVDINGRVVVSDTSLRNIPPQQLPRATKRHKQMCGCETCLTPRSNQQSLNAWRDRQLRQLKE
jgi:hypothetical protein